MAQRGWRARTGAGCGDRGSHGDWRKEGTGGPGGAAPCLCERRFRRLAELRPHAADALRRQTMAKVTLGGRTYDVEVRGDNVGADGHDYSVKAGEESGYATVTSGGVPYRVQLPAAADRASGMNVLVDYRAFILEYEGRLGGGAAPRERRTAPAAVSAGSRSL